MAWGAHAEWLSKLATQTGDVPEALRSKPELLSHLTSVWIAYFRLRGDRHVGLDLGPIPFTAIDRYAQRYGIDQIEQFDRFLELIRAMDECERAFKPQ